MIALIEFLKLSGVNSEELKSKISSLSFFSKTSSESIVLFCSDEYWKQNNKQKNKNYKREKKVA